MLSKKHKEQVGELVFGVHPVLELLKNKRRKVISFYTTRPEPKSWALIKQHLPAYPVPIQYVDREVLTRMCGSADHQNIIAWANPFVFRKKFFDPQRSPFLLMLDGIQDPRNLGAILRTAYCTNVDGVIITKRASAPLSGVALKASAGLAERLELYEASSATQAVDELKKAGYTVYTAVFKGENAAVCAFTKPLCLVIGSEGEGISKEIMHAGIAVTIPQNGIDISYNASVAAGILLFLAASKNNILRY